MFLAGLIVGCFIGGAIGVLVMSLCKAASWGDKNGNN